MRQKRLALVLLLALVSGIVAGIAALSYLRQQTRPLMAAEAPRGKLVVAAKDLPLGTVLKVEDLRLIDWPDGALPAGFAATPAEVLGRGLITQVALNEPILKTKLASKEAGGGLSITIPEGMRGVSVKVDEVIGVAGFVLPGTRVDVMVTVQPPEENASQRQAVTKLVLQNVQVLASGQTIQRDADGKPQTVTAITLMVSPEDAEKLVLAANEGRIQLALRNTLDPDSVDTRGVRVAGLVAGTASRPAPAARAVRVTPRPRTGGQGVQSPRGTVVETLRGGERTLQTFSPGNQ